MVQSLLTMAIKKQSGDHKPLIERVTPLAAITGGEFQIRGHGFVRSERPRVNFGTVQGTVIIGSDSLVIARVPEDATVGKIVIENGDGASSSWACDIGIQVADSMHPVTNPAVDSFGNVYATFSGTRGQKTPVSVYRIDPRDGVTPFLTDIMNATGLIFDRDGQLYISSRYEGIVYRADQTGALSVFVEGMGVATGMAFDDIGNLYVGDRSGTIFKISPARQIYVYATLESSISAYHLAFGPEGYLYVTGPTTSSFDTIHRISPAGEVESFFRGLGRPQGMAFDKDGSLYVAASLGGRRGVVRIAPNGEAALYLSGPNIVGVAFSPSRAMYVTTNNGVHRIDAGIEGRPLA
jgi:sugar lactone lactonase YvrE